MKVQSRQTQVDWVSEKDKETPVYNANGTAKGIGEVNSGEVMTIQNDAYKIRDLLEKFTTGVLSPEMMGLKGMDPGYDFEDQVMNGDLPEFTDVIDLEEFSVKLNAKIEAQRASLSKAEAKKAESERIAKEAEEERKLAIAIEKAKKAEANKSE